MSDIHVLPACDLVDHDEVRDCWCGPRVEQACPECDGDEAGCWRCHEGFTDLHAPEMEALVIHNAADGRE